MKVDIEGAEIPAILGGIKFITEYHIPFILMEYNPQWFHLHDIDILNFLKIFEENGYKFSFSGFLDKNYVSIYNLSKSRKQTDLYIISSKILE